MFMRRIEKLPKFVRATYSFEKLDSGTAYYNPKYAPFSIVNVYFVDSARTVWTISNDGP